jgi:hypothetical protein
MNAVGYVAATRDYVVLAESKDAAIAEIKGMHADEYNKHFRWLVTAEEIQDTQMVAHWDA